MEREAPFFLRARSCRSLVERLCIAKLPKVPERSARPAGFHWGFTMVLLGFPWPKHFQNLCPKHSKNLGKINLNTSQNRCQNLPKSSPRRSKIEVWRGSAKNPFLSPKFSAPGGRLGASWGRPGSVLGASWGRLGSLRASWELLGAVLRRLGDVLGRISLPIQLESDF